MPKLKESDVQQKDRLTRACIAKNMALYDLDDEAVAVKLRCARRTFQNKQRRPETFTLGELRRLASALHLTDEEKAQLI